MTSGRWAISASFFLSLSLNSVAVWARSGEIVHNSTPNIMANRAKTEGRIIIVPPVLIPAQLEPEYGSVVRFPEVPRMMLEKGYHGTKSAQRDCQAKCSYCTMTTTERSTTLCLTW